MKRVLLFPLGLALLVGSAAPPTPPPAPIEDFAKVHALIRPAAGEDPWAGIPWLTDLWQARRLAAEKGKPILLWEMDGHPLGCT